MTGIIVRPSPDHFKKAAKLSGHGKAFYAVITRVLSGEGYDPALLDLGIPKSRFNEVAGECVAAFNKCAPADQRIILVTPSDQGAKEENIDINSLPGIGITYIAQLDNLAKISKCAARCLSSDEFMTLLLSNLMPANSKMSYKEIASFLNASENRVKNLMITAKEKLSEELKARQPDLLEHPFIRKRNKLEGLEAGQKYTVDTSKLDASEPAAMERLFMLSSTLFEARHHYIVCNEFLYNTDIIRDRKQSAEFCGMTHRGYIGTAYQLLKTLETAASYEPDSKILLRTLEAIKIGSFYKGFKHSKGKIAAEQVDEALINLDNPYILALYEAALESSSDSSFAVFCATDLYDAEHKLTRDECMERFGLTENSVKSSRDNGRKAVKDYLKAAGKEHLLLHPILRIKDAPTKIDDTAKVL